MYRVETLAKHRDKNKVGSILNILFQNKFQMFFMDKRFKCNNQNHKSSERSYGGLVLQSQSEKDL